MNLGFQKFRSRYCKCNEGASVRKYTNNGMDLTLNNLKLTEQYVLNSINYLLFGRISDWKMRKNFSHLGMFVTTGCSSGRQSVATASRQDTSSREQNTDSGRQVTASGQFYKPNQTQEPKYGNYALLLLCRLKWKKCFYMYLQ